MEKTEEVSQTGSLDPREEKGFARSPPGCSGPLAPDALRWSSRCLGWWSPEVRRAGPLSPVQLGIVPSVLTVLINKTFESGASWQLCESAHLSLRFSIR